MGLGMGAALLIACLAAVFRSEFEAWMPWIIKTLRRRAVTQMPAGLRERLDEEWAAYLEELPGNVAKLVAAIGFNIAAHRLQVAVTASRLLATFVFWSSNQIFKAARSLDWLDSRWELRGGDKRDLSSRLQLLEGANILFLASLATRRLSLQIVVPLDDEERMVVEQALDGILETERDAHRVMQRIRRLKAQFGKGGKATR